MGLQGKYSSEYVSKVEPIIDEMKRSELFHIRVISKHTKIDNLFGSGSQANLILEIVKKHGLETSCSPNHIHLDGFVKMHNYKLLSSVDSGFL